MCTVLIAVRLIYNKPVRVCYMDNNLFMRLSMPITSTPLSFYPLSHTLSLTDFLFSSHGSASCVSGTVLSCRARSGCFSSALRISMYGNKYEKDLYSIKNAHTRIHIHIYCIYMLLYVCMYVWVKRESERDRKKSASSVLRINHLHAEQQDHSKERSWAPKYNFASILIQLHKYTHTPRHSSGNSSRAAHL